MGSTDRQSAGLPTAERITGYSPYADGVFRLRVARVSGPPPEGRITLFSREIRTLDIGGTAADSIPTPGDAGGSITVGATDWRGNALKSYSSQGPTDDGRLKPDIVAPTNTQIMGPNGFRAVGGTSNSAPNAAGPAAVLLAAARRSGQTATANEVRAQITSLALDLGAPGPDDVYGWGRVRVNTDPPRIGRLVPAQPRLRARPSDGEVRRPDALPPLLLDARGQRRPGDGAPPDLPARHHHRHPPPGPGLAPAARPGPGRARQPGVARVVGLRRNTRPRLVVRRVDRGRLVRKRRAVTLMVGAIDKVGVGKLTARTTISTNAGRRVARLTRQIAPGPLRAVPLGRLAGGRYRVRVDLADRAGNSVTVNRRIGVR